jgi:ABC-type uncharacterized transport system auxiliary subunit
MRRPAGLLLLVALGGCVFRTADPPRFFRPTSAALDAAAGDQADPPARGAVPIRLRAVRSEPFLGERIVWRASEVEYGFYEQRRWFDLPAHYVDRALRARLRSTPGLRLTDDPRADALRVDVLAFDETLAPTHLATVALATTLEDPVRGLLLEQTFKGQAEIRTDDPTSMANAMGQALDAAVAEVADAVRASAEARRARQP